jgi:hypothetical protein
MSKPKTVTPPTVTPPTVTPPTITPTDIESAIFELWKTPHKCKTPFKIISTLCVLAGINNGANIIINDRCIGIAFGIPVKVFSAIVDEKNQIFQHNNIVGSIKESTQDPEWIDFINKLFLHINKACEILNLSQKNSSKQVVNQPVKPWVFSSFVIINQTPEELFSIETLVLNFTQTSIIVMPSKIRSLQLEFIQESSLTQHQFVKKYLCAIYGSEFNNDDTIISVAIDKTFHLIIHYKDKLYCERMDKNTELIKFNNYPFCELLDMATNYMNAISTFKK